MKHLLLLLAILFVSALAHAQQGNTLTIRYAGVPTGTCGPFFLAVNNATSDEYNCTAGGAWNKISSGGGACPQGTCVVNAPTLDQAITGAHALILSDPASTFWEKNAVGVGNTAVPGSTSSFFVPIFPTILDVENTLTTVPAFTAASSVLATYLNNTADSGNIYNNAWSELSTLGSSNANFTSDLIAHYAELDHNGGGTINAATAMHGEVDLDGAGGISIGSGVDGEANNFGSGTFVTANGVESFVSLFSTGNITNAAGFRANGPSFSGAGTMSHVYGLYIADQTVGGAQNPDPWGIFIEGGKNNLGPGTTTVGNVIDSGVSASLPLCTNGSKQLATSGCGIALLASPTFTGTPAAPTAAPGTNTTQLATTAFVLANPGTPAWNTITNPAGNLSLTMAGNTSTFNTTTANATFFNWKNTTAAIVGTSQGSPLLNLCGRAFHGSADVEDCMTLSELPGNGNDATIKFNLGHTGTSTGAITTVLPSDGTAAAPALAFNGVQNTGFHRATTNIVGDIAGVAQVAFNSQLGLEMPSGNWITWSASSDPTGTSDLVLARDSSNANLSVGANGALTSGKIKAAGYMSLGTKFTTNAGCTDTTLVGGATSGKFTIGQSTSCTTIITMGNTATAPNGWSCWINDQTAIPAIGFRQSASTTTTASFTGTGTSGDVLNFGCMGY